jgi:ubiquitin-protein ligase
MSPPVLRFLTKIIHPNVSRHGDIGIDLLIQQSWSISITLSKLLLSVQSLLTDPFTNICMETEIGRLYEHETLKFNALARYWTWKFAMTEVLPPNLFRK